MPRLMTLQDVSANYRISRTRLYGLINRGEIEARKLGHRTVITEAEMERYVTSLPVHRPTTESTAA